MNFIIHARFNGNIHDEPHGMSTYKQWSGEKPDLQKYPILTFGSIVMAHVPLVL